MLGPKIQRHFCIRREALQGLKNILQYAELVKWYLYDILLNDLPLWDSNVVCRVLFAAHARERAAPGQREGASKCHLHSLPTRQLHPLSCLSLQALDTLNRTQQ